MPEKLNREVILYLLAQAGTKWYTSRSGQFNYREHLEFTAEYIVRNYNVEVDFMGCLFCNITNCEEFVQGEKPPVANPFYCKSPEGRAEFVDELCANLATRHPEVVKRIMFYTAVALVIRFKKWLRSLWPF